MNPSEYLKKMLNSWKFVQSESGQGILEYVLVLVVVVGILSGMLYQFNKSFRDFAQSYFAYIGCLLETGELPASIGGGANECSKPNLNFTAQASAGSTLAGGGGGGRGGGAGGSGSGTDGSSGSSTDSGSTTSGSGSGADGSSGSGTGGAGGAGGLDGGQSSSGADGKGGDSYSDSSGRPGRFNKNNGVSNADANSDRLSLRPERQKLKTNKDGNKKSDSKSESSGLSFRRRNRGGASALTEDVYDVDEEYITEEEKQKKEKIISGSSKIRKKGEGVSQMRKARFDMKVPDFRKMKEESEDPGFSFGFLFKILIIAGILIAIFIFLGGQALQIKKSWEK